MTVPLVSIVIPCYNHDKFVQQCIQSIIDQTYQNIELIIIDDGSKDNSVGKIQELVPLCEKRFIRFEFRYRPNKGLSATLNEALDWCQGEFYCAIASDDMMLSHKISKQLDLMQTDKDYVASFGSYQIVDGYGKKGHIFEQKDMEFNFDLLMYTDLYLPAPTQMIRTEALKQVGGYKDGIVIEDWYMWLKLLELPNSKIVYRNDLYAYYRVHGNNTFSNPYKMGLGYLQVLTEFNNHPKFERAYIKALWETLFLLFKKQPKLTLIVFAERSTKHVKRVFYKIKSN